MENQGDRLKEFISKTSYNQKEFAEFVGVAPNYISMMIKGTKPITDSFILSITKVMPDADVSSISNNKIFKKINSPEEEEASTSKKNYIPLYEDVATFGGSDNVASMESVYNTSIQIDAGDWFRGATAAVRHYGDSMIEYPSGCILAIRELKNKNEIVWGRNYVIETSERRITKQIAELDKDNIICYSTNTEKHMDGRLKHQPIIILKEDIRFISRVLGSVNKEESTGKVQLL